MHPVLVILHDRVLYAYWFFYGLGLLVSAATALWLSSRRGLPFWKIWLLCLVLVIAAFVGARTLSLIEHGLPYSEFLNLAEGGETSLGGILAAGVSAVMGSSGDTIPNYWKEKGISPIIEGVPGRSVSK